MSIIESILNPHVIYSLGIKSFAFILVLMIIVVIHEFGHYIVARMIGAEVEVFSIGLGKKLFSFEDRHKTVWQICALPIGGYVRIKGENGENLGEQAQEIIEGDEKNNLKKESIKTQEENNFEDKAPWKKALVVLAGPFFNFILSFVVIFFLFSFEGKPSLDLKGEYEIMIASVSNGSVAFRFGIEVGDKILEINSEKVKNFQDLQEKLKKNSGNEIVLKIFSHKKKSEQDLILKLDDDAKLGVGLAPISSSENQKFEKLNLLESAIQSFQYNLKLIKMTISGIINLFSAPEEMKNIGGLVQIANFSGAAIQSGFMNFLFFLALLSINLGIINLFPLPALDGGRFIFYFLDMIWVGKFISQRIRGYSIGLSFFLLIALMIFANLNDIHKIFFHK
jgi:regulator of sigma E protease